MTTVLNVKRVFAALALGVVLAAGGCKTGLQQPCTGHGGIKYYVKPVFYCNDGTNALSNGLHGS
jgi:hypothetical protein